MERDQKEVPSAPGFVWTDDTLRIHTGLVQMRLRWRPVPFAEERLLAMRRWRPFWPEFRLVRPEEPRAMRSFGGPVDGHGEAGTPSMAEGKAAAFAAFRGALSAELVRQVERFGSHQWPLLVLLHDQPRAMDLAVSNPVLAYALANNHQFRGTRIDAAGFQAICYSHRKQRVVLDWLGFPGTEAMAKLLRKMAPESASPLILRCLRNAVRTAPEVMDHLAHLPSLNDAVIELIAHSRIRNLVTAKLLHEVAVLPGGAGGMSPGDMILGGLSMLDEMDPKRVIRPFSSIAQVGRFQEQMDADYQRHLRQQDEARRAAQDALARLEEQQQEEKKRKAEWAGRSFPSPPIPGTECIVPITSREALFKEGREQAHCVGSYVSLVEKGQVYIYGVLSPERATLSIIRGADGGWRRSELKARGNRAVQVGTLHGVDAWLAAYRVSV